MEIVSERAKERLKDIAEAEAIRKMERGIQRQKAQELEDCFSESVCPLCGENLVRVKQFLGFFREPKKYCVHCNKAWQRVTERFEMPPCVTGVCHWRSIPPPSKV